jgi:hypothetical protein
MIQADYDILKPSSLVAPNLELDILWTLNKGTLVPWFIRCNFPVLTDDRNYTIVSPDVQGLLARMTDY